MNLVEALQKAKAFIANENNWLQGDRYGDSRDGKGKGFCALGALDKALYNGTNIRSDVYAILAKTAKLTSESPKDPYNSDYRGYDLYDNESRIAHYNNISDHQTVMKWFDEAIKDAERFVSA